MLRSFRRHGLAAVFASFIGWFGLAPAANASFTTIGSPPSGEKSIREILNHIYNTTFNANGLNYTSSSLTATRIEDVLEGLHRGPVTPLNLLDGNPSTAGDGGGMTTMVQGGVGVSDDQLWTASAVSATAQARFADFSQEFGIVTGTSGGSYQSLIDIQGSGFNVSGFKNISNLSNLIWRWARGGQNGVFTSQNSDNPNSIDHMVTYKITENFQAGGSTAPVNKYILFFEDLKPTQQPDYDYNDLAIEICATPANSAVPEPASVGVLLLGAIGLTRRHRRSA